MISHCHCPILTAHNRNSFKISWTKTNDAMISKAVIGHFYLILRFHWLAGSSLRWTRYCSQPMRKQDLMKLTNHRHGIWMQLKGRWLTASLVDRYHVHVHYNEWKIMPFLSKDQIKVYFILLFVWFLHFIAHIQNVQIYRVGESKEDLYICIYM